MDYTVPIIQVKSFDPTEMPDPECPLPERALWWQLRDVYAKYRAGTISKDQGEKQKQAAMRVYERDKAQYSSLQRVQQHQAQMWVKIEQAGREYAKSNNRTPEADTFYEAVYGCKLKDAM